MKKILFSILLISSLVLSCTGKAGTDKASTSTSGDTKKIVLITMDSIDEHWLSVKKGAEDKAAELGNIELIFTNHHNIDDTEYDDCRNQKSSEIKESQVHFPIVPNYTADSGC